MLLSTALKALPMTVINEALGRGWEAYADSVYIEASPLVVNNAIVPITCDGLAAGTIVSEKPAGATPLWNTTTNKINPIADGDSYDLRIQFNGKSSAVSGVFDFELDIGGTQGVIFSRTLSTPKGINTEVRYSIGVPIYTMTTFLANGGTLNINTTFSGITLSAYDFSIFEKRDYSANGSRV